MAEAGEMLRIGVSACLLGQEVRYDGGHKRAAFVTDELAKYAELLPVCPELEVGMGVPREPVRLVRVGERTKMVAKSGRDWTEAMEAFAARRVRGLSDIDGYILKKDSPSCGMERVKLDGARQGVGLFAAELMRQRPLLPVEEEGRLNDAALRENFVERVFAFRRLKQMKHLVAFHTAEKLLLMAHDPVAYATLGRLVATGRKDVKDEYARVFMGAMAKLATTRKHTNVLSHMAGYFKKSLDAEDRAELRGVIEDFRKGLVPLVVPIALLRHHVRKQKVAYLAGQTYLEPHPKELMLRNHV